MMSCAGQTSQLWSPPSAFSRLETGAVHVWSANLDQSLMVQGALEGTLSAAERGRASRYCFERDRARFIISRGVLRQLLGNYLGIDPAAVLLQYGGNGKPFLADFHGNSANLYFNLSHSGPLALYAFSSSYEVGIDVERVAHLIEMTDIAKSFFSHADKAEFEAAPAEGKTETFFKLWTRQEAVAKCLGKGIVEGAIARAFRGITRELFPAQGYAAAVAVAAERYDLKTWRCPVEQMVFVT